MSFDQQMQNLVEAVRFCDGIDAEGDIVRQGTNFLGSVSGGDWLRAPMQQRLFMPM